MANIQKRYDLFIDGKFVPASDGKTFEATIPPTEKCLRLLRKRPGKMWIWR